MKLRNSEAIDNLNDNQQLLVQACLARSKDEREAKVAEWEHSVIIDEIDFSSSRLIPFFLHGNQKLGITTQHDNRLKIVYKHWWLRTQHISHQLEIVYGALVSAGIDCIIIKGASIKKHYELDVLRPMADFDLLVKPNDLAKAFSIIKTLGYTPNPLSEAYWKTDSRLFMDFEHAISCTHKKNDTQVDLHWRVGSHCSTLFTNHLWQNLETYEKIADAVKPALAYEVFMLIIHGVASANKDNLNWIVDMAVIHESQDRSFWMEARRIAVEEKKEDLYDYGCLLLTKFGIPAPIRPEVKTPRVIVSTVSGDAEGKSLLRLLPRRLRNMRYSVDRLFPHANRITKYYQMLRRIQYYMLSKKVRRSKESSLISHDSPKQTG